MDHNTKEAQDNTGDGAFFIGGVAFSSVCKINNNIGYMLRLEVACVYFFPEFMGICAIKSRRVHDWVVGASIKVSDEVH